MASWTALNVEPDSDTDEEEYDNTKEIQIEEAIKLYQNAIKLHAKGPSLHDETQKAYEALLASEIFTYPESQTQYHQNTAQRSIDDSESEPEYVVDPSLAIPARPDAASDTLPQIIFLSLKNYGQFLMDRLEDQRKKRRRRLIELEDEQLLAEDREIVARSLKLFIEAVDKDESDRSLWRKISKLALFLGSRRLARFALESCLAIGAREDASILVGFNIEDQLVQNDLNALVQSIGDKQVHFASTIPINTTMKSRMDPFPTLPAAPFVSLSKTHKTPEPATLGVDQSSWEGVGRVIRDAQKADRSGLEERMNLTYRIALPDIPNHTRERANTKDLITADTLSKRRLSQSPNLSTKPLPSDFKKAAENQTTSPIVSHKGLRANSDASSQQGVSGIAEQTINAREAQLSDSNHSPADQPVTDARPSSKRTSEKAGLDPPEGGRSRSKRLRARAETLAEENVDPQVLARHYEEQLQQYVQADEWVFSVVMEMSSKASVKCNETALAFRSILSASSDQQNGRNFADHMIPSLLDFRHSLSSWNLNKSNLMLNGTGAGASVTLIENGGDSGFAAFLEHAKSGTKKSTTNENILRDQDLSVFVDQVNAGRRHIEHITLMWLQSLLRPMIEASADSHENGSTVSKYLSFEWLGNLKDLVSEALIDEDDMVYSSVFDNFDYFTSSTSSQDANQSNPGDILGSIEFAQTVFELHLDIYGKMTSPDSKVDQPSRVAQRDRIARWASLANLAVSRADLLEGFGGKGLSLALRHLWSYVVYVSFVEVASRDHILLCYKDLQSTLEFRGSPTYFLPNNTIMPEISVAALEREISREKTMDFFSNIFGANSEDPVALIYNLEPVLMESPVNVNMLHRLIQHEQEIKDSQDSIETDIATTTDDTTVEQRAETKNSQLSEFLQKASAQLRLSLWHQLKAAYASIDYSPMRIVCNFRSMLIILKELQSPNYLEDSREDRSANLIVWVRNLIDLATQCLEITKADPRAFECLAEDNLRIALSSCIEFVKLIHVFAVWEDSVRIGQFQYPVQPAGAVVGHKSSMNLLREMQPKAWHLLYLVCLESASQSLAMFPALKEDRLEMLRAIHNAFALRDYCRLGRKSFLKFMKSELLLLDAPEDEISQVLYDLYNLKICQHGSSVLDHGCTGDQMDRASALEIVRFVIQQAKRMNIKDVLKSDLKIAAEKMQAVIGSPRGSSTAQSFNRKMIASHLKSPIFPTTLYRSLSGMNVLNSMAVKSEFATVAGNKWFFLVGHIHLTKYTSQKRTSPDDSDDLDIAERFLKLDLEFDVEDWETWYRLAQTYDAKIEESVAWNTDKINNPISDLVSLQRQAIHCYEMAESLAVRNADDSPEADIMLSELHADFANRLYSSSRAPFNMKVFDLKGYERFVNRAEVGTFKQQASTEVKDHVVWKIASKLYRQALAFTPDAWVNWYMLSKCKWKLYKYDSVSMVGWREAVEACIRALQCAPEKKDGRHSEKDPILEPHYKLLSLVYKLLRNGSLSAADGMLILTNSHFSRKISCTDESPWTLWITDVLRAMRNADKANWHHRMVARAAHLAYDARRTVEAAQAAKDKLTQQMFTKSMQIQVWRPENERAGRHFVYLTHYVQFFIKILVQIGDRTSLEMLGKRIRKKQGDFIDHTKIWKYLCDQHLMLIREQGKIHVGYEDRIFRNTMPFEVYTRDANRLEAWGHSQLSLSHPTFGLLQETIELKKLSGSLIDKGPFDDLAADIYAKIYEQVVPELIARAGEAENRERMRIERMLMDAESPQPGPATGESAPHAGRTKTVSRTEVRRRADVLVARPGFTTGRGKGAAAAAVTESSSPVRIRRQSELAPRSEAIAAASSDAEPTASLHDEADDESELSDIEDEVEEQEPDEEDEGEAEELRPQLKPMFPGLAVPAGPVNSESRDTTLSAEPQDAMEGVEGAKVSTKVNV